MPARSWMFVILTLVGCGGRVNTEGSSTDAGDDGAGGACSQCQMSLLATSHGIRQLVTRPGGEVVLFSDDGVVLVGSDGTKTNLATLASAPAAVAADANRVLWSETGANRVNAVDFVSHSLKTFSIQAPVGIAPTQDGGFAAVTKGSASVYLYDQSGALVVQLGPGLGEHPGALFAHDPFYIFGDYGSPGTEKSGSVQVFYYTAGGSRYDENPLDSAIDGFFGLAVGATHAIWASSKGDVSIGLIQRATQGYDVRSWASGLGTPTAFTADDSAAYLSIPGSAGTRIVKVSADGTTDVATLSSVTALALDSSVIYVSDGSGLFRIPRACVCQ